MKDFFKHRENLAALAISGIAAINSLFFLASKNVFPLFSNSLGNNIFYFIYFSSLIAWAGICFSKEKIDLLDSLKKTLLIFLPTEIDENALADLVCQKVRVLLNSHSLVRLKTLFDLS